MSVKLLTDQIWKEAEKEKESLRKSLNGEIGRIDRIYQEKIKAVEKNLRIDLEKEKEKEISSYKERKDFELKMERLLLKEELLNKAVSKIKKDFSGLPLKEVYKKKLAELKSLSPVKVIVPLGEASLFKEIFPGIKIEEGSIKNGFIVEGEKFFFEVSIDLIIDETVSNEKGYFSSLLL